MEASERRDVALVEREVIKVVEKFRNLYKSNSRSLDETILLIRAAKDEVQHGKKVYFNFIQVQDQLRSFQEPSPIPTI